METRFDDSGQVLFINFVGPTTVADLASGLAVCFERFAGSTTRAVFDIRDMGVNFNIKDVASLADTIHHTSAVGGRMAFVSGDQRFLSAIVNSVRSLRRSWKTEWRLFGSVDEATAWVTASKDPVSA